VRQFLITTADQRDRLFQFLSKRELPMQVDVGEPRKQRTDPQNRRLWDLHTLASEHTGYTKDEMHEEALCKHFGYTEKKMPSGWIKRVPLKRSSTREVAEFAKFMEETENWYAAEFGIWLGMEEAA
jgi:hypothetical protein